MNQSKRWYDIVTNIAQIHDKKCRENPGWTLDDTRRLAGYSIGYVSESLRLYKAIQENAKILQCPDRETALGKLRPGQEVYPNHTKVLVKIGNTFEQGIIVGRGTVLPRDTVWVVKLDHPFFFERASKRMDMVVAHTSEIKELDV